MPNNSRQQKVREELKDAVLATRQLENIDDIFRCIVRLFDINQQDQKMRLQFLLFSVAYMFTDERKNYGLGIGADSLDQIAGKLQDALLAMEDQKTFQANSEKLGRAVRNEEIRIANKIPPHTSLYTLISYMRGMIHLIEIAKKNEYKKAGMKPKKPVFNAIVHIAHFWEEEFGLKYTAGFESQDFDQPTNKAGLFTYLCLLYLGRELFDAEIRTALKRQSRAVSSVSRKKSLNELLRM